MLKTLTKHWAIILFGLTLLIRIPLLDGMQRVNYPEYFRDYYQLTIMARGHWPLAGPPSMQTDFRFGPVYYYLMFPIFWLCRGWAGSVLLTEILLYAWSASIFYLLLRQWLKSHSAAVAGSLFYCCGIYGLQLTSFASNPNFLPLFVVSVLYSLSRLLAGEDSVKNYFLLGLCYGLAAQLHLTAALVLGLVLAVGFIVKLIQKTLTFKGCLAFICSGLASFIPYGIYLWQTRGAGLMALGKFSSAHLTGAKGQSGLEAIIRFFSGSFNPFDLSNSYSFIQPSWLYLLLALDALALLGYLIYKFFKHASQNQATSPKLDLNIKLILGSWAVSAALMILLFNRAAHDHYLIIFWPLPAVIFALCWQWLENRFQLGRAILVFFAVIWVCQAYSFFLIPSYSWKNFYQIFQARYNHAEVLNIGFSPIQQ